MSKTLLHVGCGPNTRKQTIRHFSAGDWREIRYDIDPAVQPDIIGGVTDLSAIADGTIDAIFSSHNIEHVFAHEVDIMLREFLRVLTPQGYAVITCPDLKAICRLVVEDGLNQPAYQSPSGPITPHDVIYGHGRFIAEGNHYMAHKCGFTLATLQRCLVDAGFGTVAALEVQKAYALWAVARKERVPVEEHIAFARQVLA